MSGDEAGQWEWRQIFYEQGSLFRKSADEDLGPEEGSGPSQKNTFGRTDKLLDNKRKSPQISLYS